jgi:PncC family amidohydrolase
MSSISARSISNVVLRERAVSTFADPLPPAFFPVALRLTGQRCVVIGNDEEARMKAASLREVGADVRVIQDAASLSEDDLRDAFFVISTPIDAELSARLRQLAEKYRFLLCTIDQPEFGFVAMQAIVKAGPVRIAIGTGGVAPRVGKILKDALSRVLDAKFRAFLDCLATQKLRNRHRMAGDPVRRRREMTAAAEGFEVAISLRYPDWFEEREAEIDEDALAGAIVRELAKRGLTLAFAESCSGGLLADAIVRHPGASAVFRGSVVAYANDVKERILGVSSEILAREGAVSEACATAMAQGALERLEADFALSVTGIAGPEGGSADKPVGTFYIGVASRAHSVVAHRRFWGGGRADIRSRSVLAALMLLRDEIEA